MGSPFLEDSLSGPLGNSVVSLAALRTNFPYTCYLDKEMTETFLTFGLTMFSRFGLGGAWL